MYKWSPVLMFCSILITIGQVRFNSVYEKKYHLIINVVILISYHYIMFIVIFLFSWHELPLLKCSEEDCLADFVLRKDARLNNTGACSLKF